MNGMFAEVWSEGFFRLPEFCSEVFECVSGKDRGLRRRFFEKEKNDVVRI